MATLGQAPGPWQAVGCCYGPGLDLELARKMLEAGEKEALKQGVPMSMAIADAGGNLLAFHRMVNAFLGSIQIAQDKAFTSAFGKMPTANYDALYRSGELIPLFFHERWITFNGGYPLIKDGILMGGLGVSGGIIEDIFVARAMLKTGGFDCSAADGVLKEYEAGLKKQKPQKAKGKK